MGSGPLQRVSDAFTENWHTGVSNSVALNTEAQITLPTGGRNILIQAEGAGTFRYATLPGIVAAGGPTVPAGSALVIDGPLGEDRILYWATATHPTTLRINGEMVI